MSLSSIDILFDIIAFLFAISIHESAHAWTANRLGDPTARLLGRISLNPVRHIDPVGTVLFPLIGAISHAPVFGWAKPTPVNPLRLRHPVRDDVFISAAGPLSNFLVASGAAVLLLALRLTSAEAAQILTGVGRFEAGPGSESVITPLVFLLYSVLSVNVILAVFNLIPIPPLDGGHILEGLLPDSLRPFFEEVKPFGFLLLFGLIAFGGITSMLFSPFLHFFHALVRI